MTENLKEKDLEKKMTLFDLSAQMAQIEAELYENGGEITPELEQAMAETKDGLVGKVDGYNAVYQKLGATAAAAKAEIERLTKIKKAAENGQKSLKEHILYNMGVFGLDRLDGELCRMTRRRSSALKVDEELMLRPYRDMIDRLNGQLPVWITVKADISKQAIKDEFKGTDMLPAGCEMVESESLQIR